MRLFDILVFKNTKWPARVYMLVIPRRTGYMFMDLGLISFSPGLAVYWVQVPGLNYVSETQTTPQLHTQSKILLNCATKSAINYRWLVT